MKVTKKEGSNYIITVVSLPKKQPIPGLDNLVSVSVFGDDCLIPKDSPESPLYLFIPAGTELSPQFMSHNNLYTDKALNRNQNKKGYIKDNRHVRSLKLRGVISTGLLLPIYALDYLKDFDLNELKKGMEFDTIGDTVICCKYVPPYQKSQNPQNPPKKDKLAQRFDKLVDNQFRLHGDTAHLSRNTHIFDLDDVIAITSKLHGCCGNFANVLVNKDLSLGHRLLKRLGVPVQDKVYDNIYASRTVIKNRYINKEVSKGFYNEDVWGVVNKELEGKIEEGITLMGEIVGYTPENRAIQKGYDYGCGPGEHKFFVYRITYTKPNGQVIEFSWQMIKEYCKKYDILHVPAYFHGTIKEFFDTYALELDRPDWADRWFNHLSISYNMEKPCELCLNNVPAEGLVVRKDGMPNFSAFKLKAKSFILGENELLDKGDAGMDN